MTECQNAKSKLDLFVFNAEANNLDRTDVFTWLTSKGVPVVVATRLESLGEVTKKIADTTISLGKILISKLIEFIQAHPYTAIGVAMGQAKEDVKAAADYVTAPIDEDGISKAMKHFGII